MVNVDQSDYSFLENIIQTQYPYEPPTGDPSLDLLEPQIDQEEFKSVLNPNPVPKKTRKKSSYLSSFKTKTGKSPKKEYVRCKLIRGHKRAIRNALAGKRPKKTINRISFKNKQQNAKLECFSKDCILNKTILENVSRAENGPKTDGISKKTREDLEKSEKSFNDSYCRKYFADRFTQKSFELYCDVLFYGSGLNDLCEKFDFSCCANKTSHSVDCAGKWRNLERFLKFEMIEELGLVLSKVGEGSLSN